mmetsp:Transcript_8764/g.17345  ORF Transcript_8764/g.17345 Transcript_8764/m.17345 type:complete len:88 (-) Transcript_8764:598-861(-)
MASLEMILKRTPNIEDCNGGMGFVKTSSLRVMLDLSLVLGLFSYEEKQRATQLNMQLSEEEKLIPGSIYCSCALCDDENHTAKRYMC